MTDPAPYLTPTEVRSRISVGGPTLDAGKFSDEWVARQVAIWERKLERHTGDAYVEREATVTLSGRGSCFAALVLPNVNIITVDSVTVDGDAITIDEHQPELANGLVRYAAGFRLGSTVVASYSYCQPDEGLCEVAFEACAKWIERIATMERAGNTPDVIRQGFDGGGTTVFSTPDPNASPPRLTGFREVDDLVNILPRYTTAGVA